MSDFIKSQFADPIDRGAISFDLFCFSVVHKFQIVQIQPSVHQLILICAKYVLHILILIWLNTKQFKILKLPCDRKKPPTSSTRTIQKSAIVLSQSLLATSKEIKNQWLAESPATWILGTKKAHGWEARYTPHRNGMHKIRYEKMIVRKTSLFLVFVLHIYSVFLLNIRLVPRVNSAD